jgi:macrolide transport system ATP-binding/permease protein
MQVATLKRVSKGFGPVTVLHDVSFAVQAGERLGLVGANGVGKSTLLRLLAGELPPDRGEIAFPRPVDVGYLPQETPVRPGQTVDDAVREAQGRVAEVTRQLEAAEGALATAGPAEAPALLETYADLAERFEGLGGYDLEHRSAAVFAGLGIEHLDREREVGSLSGGEKARVGLAALLLRGPDLLLLDEPTNHLDFRALAWLEGFVREHRATFVVVSHDRQFLNRTATSIAEIDEHLRDVRVYPGSYDAFLVLKAREREQWEEAYAREQAELRLLREAIRGPARRVGHPNRPPPDKDKYARQFFGENAQRAVSRNVRATQEKLRRIEENPVLRPPEPLRLRPDFDPAALAGRTPLVATGLVKGYRGRTVLAGVDLALAPGSRTVITGPNGAGKSTLLRLLAGRERPDAGAVRLAPKVVVGSLDQESDGLDPGETVFEAYRRGLLGEADELRAGLARHGFFRHEDVGKRVGDLSAGQRRKLQLARLVATRANLLLLDEPTNHLDFLTLEAFEAALAAFPGPVLAVSHDRRFIERFAGEVWELAGGRLAGTAGGAAPHEARP